MLTPLARENGGQGLELDYFVLTGQAAKTIVARSLMKLQS